MYFKLFVIFLFLKNIQYKSLFLKAHFMLCRFGGTLLLYNIINTHSSHYLFIIFEKVLPHITPFEFEDGINSGESILLTCNVAKGDLPLDISWSFHGEELSSHIEITTTKIGDRASLLTIASAKSEHSGIYTCTAKNVAGQSTETAILKVNGQHK